MDGWVTRLSCWGPSSVLRVADVATCVVQRYSIKGSPHGAVVTADGDAFDKEVIFVLLLACIVFKWDINRHCHRMGGQVPSHVNVTAIGTQVARRHSRSTDP